jgi:hypothetical protein
MDHPELTSPYSVQSISSQEEFGWSMPSEPDLEFGTVCHIFVNDATIKADKAQGRTQGA